MVSLAFLVPGLAPGLLGLAPPWPAVSTVGGELDTADPSEVDGPPVGVDASELAARESLQRGVALYETQRYDAAIEAFTEAFSYAGAIGDPALRERSTATMLFNLARAHVGAYGVDEDANHLRQAERLVLKYREAERGAGNDPDSDADLRRLEREIATALDAIAAAERPRGGVRRPVLLWSGVGVLAASAGAMAAMGAGLWMGASAESRYLEVDSAGARAREDRRGRTGNTLAVAGGAAAGVLAAVGVGLVVGAYRGGPDAADVGPDRTAGRVRVSAELGPTGGGVIVGGRF